MAMYRHFPSLSLSSASSHEFIQAASPLNISTCSEPSLIPLMQLFQPCEATASATFTIQHPASTEPRIPEVDLNQDSETEQNSSPVLVSPAGFTGSATMSAEIRPGLPALTSFQRSCQLTDVFALSSSTMDVYITARDTSDTFRNYKDRCSDQSSALLSQGINWISCRFVLSVSVFTTTLAQRLSNTSLHVSWALVWTTMKLLAGIP